MVLCNSVCCVCIGISRGRPMRHGRPRRPPGRFEGSIFSWHKSRKTMRKTTPETALKRACRDFLAYHHIWTFPVVGAMGSYPGIADRLGFYKGRGLAIEFKRPKGVLNPSQVEFKKQWEDEGGLYITCRSVEDLANGLGIRTLLT